MATMGSLRSFGMLLLAANQAFAQDFTNGSTTPTVTSLTPSPSATGPCCFYLPQFVGLNVWLTTSLTATVATVITSVLRYNDTVRTTSTTILNPAATQNISIPADLLGDGIYTRTMVENVTAVTTGWEDQVMASPTPFVGLSIVLYIPGQLATDPTATATCTPSPQAGDPAQFWDILGTPYAWVPSPTTVWSVGGYVEAPTGLIDAWVSQTPDITNKYPDLTKCQPLSGSGEPSIHVPVEGLTDHSTTTINMDGGGGGDQPDPTSPPDSTSNPAPTSNPVPSTTPEPVVTDDPTTSPPPPTSEPQPTQNPPQSTGGNPNPPQSSGGNSNPPPASSGNNNPPAPQPTGGDGPPVVVVPAPSGSGVVIPGQSSTLTPGQTTTISGIEVVVPTAQPTEVTLPGGEVLTPGATTTISGSEIVVPTNFVVVDGTTVPVQTPVVTQAPVSSITIGSETIAITPGSSGIVLPNGDTLLPGSTTTIGGETIVLSTGPSETNVQVIESSTTETIPLYTPTTSTPSGGSPEYTGAAVQKKLEDWTWLAAAGVFALL